jgi:hypothetical protein
MRRRLFLTFHTLVLTLSLLLSSQSAIAKEDIFVTMDDIRCHRTNEIQDNEDKHESLQCKITKPSMAFKNQQDELKEPPLTVEMFVGLWKKDNKLKMKDSFADNPPNAFLTFMQGDNECQAELVVAKAYLKDGDIYFIARPLSTEKSFKIDGERVSEKVFLKHINADNKSDITMLIDDVWCLLDGRC